jgi:hypothetical protein
LLLVLLPHAASASDNPLGMSVVETKDLKLFYFDPLDFLTPHTVRAYTNSLAWQRRTFGWTPAEPTTILLKDLADYGNASANVAAHDKLVFDIAPQSRSFETFPSSERLVALMNHEMVHIAQGDISSTEDRRWRSLFLGKVRPTAEHPESLLYNYLTVPRFTAPRWFVEGAAVFMDTWMGGGVGRAQGGYDEMVFRALVRDGAPFYDPLGLESRGVRVDFQIQANAYLYGTRFLTWLAYAHSPEKVIAWIRRDEDSRRYYSDQFRHVFGTALEQAWRDWVAFEHEFQTRNLAEVRKHPITPHRTLSAGAVGSISRMFYDEKNATIYAAFRYPGVVEHVGAINTRDGTLRQLADIKRAMLYRVSSFAYDPASGTAFYTNDNLAFRDLMAVDVKTGTSRMLLENARIGEIAFNPVDHSLIGIQHVKGMATLVRVPYPYDRYERIFEFAYEHVPYDLDISADGRLLSASVGEVNGDQFLRVWELQKVLAADLKPLSEFRFGQSVPESFVFSQDGRYLYGSSYYSGVSNIYRYEVASGKIEALSNAEVGFFRPVPLADGRLLVLNYTAEGFVPAIIDGKPIEDVSAIKFLGAELAVKHPVVTTWQVPSPRVVDYDKVVVSKGPFDPFRMLGLDNAYPVLQGYKNSVGLGYRVNIADPLGFAKVGITAAYTPTGDLPGNQRGHLEVTGEYLGWRGSLSLNRSDFYDLFGPTKRSRKGYAAKAGYDQLLIWDYPRRMTLKYDLAYYDGIDVLPEAQNVATSFTRLLTGEVGLYYSDLRRSLGAVDDDKGWAWSIVANASRANDQVVPQLRASLDVGIPLPIGHASLWLRSAAGIASGDRDNPLANFYFGGFGNNYVDSGAIKRYREYYAMPGFELNSISGRRFARAMAEVNVPPLVFERMGLPGFHLAWLRSAAFVSTLWTEADASGRRTTQSSVGAQADLHFSVLHWSEATLSIGYAFGFESTRRKGNEFMISLKIL